MLEWARLADQIARRESRDSLETDHTMRLALVKALQDIGEAANKVTVETRVLHQSIPWRDIIGMRHRLVHVYYAIDLNVVWKTATGHVPPLIDYLGASLEPDN